MDREGDSLPEYIDGSCQEYRDKCYRAMSERMHRVVSFVTNCHTVADVGCDHGYMSIDLLNRGVVKRAIAIEVRQGPLQRVREHCMEAGLTGLMECRLSDGMDALRPGEADCAVIAGMGGMLMMDILERGRVGKVLPDILILQPQSDIDKVRGYLLTVGYQIENEAFLCERGKYYTVIRAVSEVRMEQGLLRDGGEAYTEAELLYGKCLLLAKDPMLYEYLMRESEGQRLLRDRLQQELHDQPTDKLASRLELLEHQMELNREAIRYYSSERTSSVIT